MSERLIQCYVICSWKTFERECILINMIKETRKTFFYKEHNIKITYAMKILSELYQRKKHQYRENCFMFLLKVKGIFSRFFGVLSFWKGMSSTNGLLRTLVLMHRHRLGTFPKLSPRLPGLFLLTPIDARHPTAYRLVMCWMGFTTSCLRHFSRAFRSCLLNRCCQHRLWKRRKL